MDPNEPRSQINYDPFPITPSQIMAQQRSQRHGTNDPPPNYLPEYLTTPTPIPPQYRQQGVKEVRVMSKTRDFHSTNRVMTSTTSRTSGRTVVTHTEIPEVYFQQKRTSKPESIEGYYAHQESPRSSLEIPQIIQTKPSNASMISNTSLDRSNYYDALSTRMEYPADPQPTSKESWNSAQYSKATRHHLAMGSGMIAEYHSVISKLQFPAVALDVGCGTGELTKILGYFTNFAQIDAIDISTSRLLLADVFIDDNRIQFYQSDVSRSDSWPKEVTNCNLATSFAVFDTMSQGQIHNALVNINRALEDDGLFIGYFEHSIPEAYKAILNMLLGETKYSPFVDDASIRAALARDEHEKETRTKMFEVQLKESGFQIAKCEKRQFKHYYFEPEINEYISSFASDLASVPKDLEVEFLEDIASTMIQACAQLEVGFVYQTEQIVFEARKA